ncbi:MAG TPA: hypothetical protein VE377_04170 [Candidatus Dormibacteraeota bacterium]|nr:hypothetical protein [Candidatus Dormibacteraeota bacterium]
MSNRFRQVPIAVGILFFLVAAGCSSGPNKITPPGVQFVTPASSPSIDQGQSVNLTVSVADSSAVTWSLQTGFGTPVGSLSNQTGTSATYTAPASVSKQTQVTILATAGTNSASLAVFVEPAPQVTGTSSATVLSCPASGSVVLSSAAGTKVVGQASSPGDLEVLESGGIAPFTWAVASGSLPAGLTLQLGSDTSKPSIVGTPITPGCSSFALQVTDAAGVTGTSQTFNLVVIPAAIKTNSPSLHYALIDSSNNGVPYQPAQLLASGGTLPYTWSLAPGVAGQSNFPPGLSMTSGGLITGVPSAGALTQNGGFGTYFPNLLVSDSQFPYPATALPSISIPVLAANYSCDTGLESDLKAQGSYAFQLRGFDANGPVTITGNFTVDGAGAITGGNEDINRTTGAQTGLSITPSSTYTLGRGKRGCVTLVNSAGTTTLFRIAVGGCSSGRDTNGADCQTPQAGGSFYFTSGHMVEFDDSTGSGTRVSGIVRLQDSATFQDSGISGMYAFGLSGWDVANGRFAMAGSATAGSGTWSSVAADTNDAGTLGSTLTGGSGTFTVGAGGRGTGTISAGTLSLNVVLYPVSSHEVMIATVGPASVTNPILSGEAISTGEPFSFQSLQNTHIFHIDGLSALGPDPSVGILAFDGLGGLTGTEFENQSGTLSATALSGAYSMDSGTGRFAFFAGQNQNVGLHPMVGYVIPAPGNLTSAACITPGACVTGFLLSTDSTAQAGVLEFQTPPVGPPPPFTATAIEGDYVFGTDEPMDKDTVTFSGHASANPGGLSISANQDTSQGNTNYCMQANCLLLTPDDQAILGYAVNSNGTGTFGGQTASVTNGSDTFYIDESPLNLHPVVVVVQE